MQSMKRQDVMDFSVRLRSALQDAGVRPSPTIVANIFNQKYWGKSITPHTARSWLVGTSIPMQDKLVVLSEWLKVSPHELRFGIDKSAPTVQLAKENDEVTGRLNLQDREMLRRYLQLPPQGKNVVREVVEAFASSASAKKRAELKHWVLTDCSGVWQQYCKRGTITHLGFDLNGATVFFNHFFHNSQAHATALTGSTGSVKSFKNAP